MNKATRYALRFFAGLAILGVLQLSVVTLVPVSSPYSSALSVMAVSSVQAASGCNMTVCGPGGILCRSMNPPPNANCTTNNNGCHSKAC
jgi:hypothetical protein